MAVITIEAIYRHAFTQQPSAHDGSILILHKSKPITTIYCQGVIVSLKGGAFVLDDGTGVIRGALQPAGSAGAAEAAAEVFCSGGAKAQLKVGDYCAVKGVPAMVSRAREVESQMQLHDCQVDVIADPNMETLWLLEMSS